MRRPIGPSPASRLPPARATASTSMPTWPALVIASGAAPVAACCGSWVVQYRHAGIVRRYLIGPAEAIGAEQCASRRAKASGSDRFGRRPAGGARRSPRPRPVNLPNHRRRIRGARAAALRPKTLRDLRLVLGRARTSARSTARRSTVSGAKKLPPSRRHRARARHADGVTSTCGPCQAMYIWAMRSGLTEANPAANTPKPSIGAAAIACSRTTNSAVSGAPPATMTMGG